MLISVLRDSNHWNPDLRHIAQIGDIPVIDSDTGAASLLAIAGDGALLALTVMTGSEILHAIRQQRLNPAILALREQSVWAYLIIIGTLLPDSGGDKTIYDGKVTGWTWNSVQGALASVQEFGVSVLTIRHMSQIGTLVEHLAARDRSQKRVRPPREVLWSLPDEEILMSLPGIGEQRANDLLDYCGSAKWTLMALTDMSMPVPAGIGSETRQRVREALGLEPGEILAVYRPETMQPAERNDTKMKEEKEYDERHDRPSSSQQRAA